MELKLWRVTAVVFLILLVLGYIKNQQGEEDYDQHCQEEFGTDKKSVSINKKVRIKGRLVNANRIVILCEEKQK